MARRSVLKASDADRERIAERLRHATAEGRLLTEELEHRLGAAFSARTYGELDPLVADLPNTHKGGQVARRRPSPLVLAAAVAAVAVVLLMVLAVLLLAIGLFAIWGFWIVLAWAVFGGRRRAIAQSAHHHRNVRWGASGCRGRRVQAGRPGFWL